MATPQNRRVAVVVGAALGAAVAAVALSGPPRKVTRAASVFVRDRTWFQSSLAPALAALKARPKPAARRRVNASPRRTSSHPPSTLIEVPPPR